MSSWQCPKCQTWMWASRIACRNLACSAGWPPLRTKKVGKEVNKPVARTSSKETVAATPSGTGQPLQANAAAAPEALSAATAKSRINDLKQAVKYLTPVGGEALSTAQAELTRLQNMKHDPRPLGARLDGLKGVINRSYKRIDKMEADRAALDLRWMREHLHTQMAEIELPDLFEDPQPWLQLIGRPQWKSLLT